MHIALFGGTFDPPHNGHLALCLFARELLSIDRLIISVSNNPLKQPRLVTDHHRKQMAELLSSEINNTGACCEISGWELEKKHPSYTVDLLRYLHTCYPCATLTLLVGEDSFNDFPVWKEPQSLFKLCHVVVFRRASAKEVEVAYEENETASIINFASPVSSTEVRSLIASGQSSATLVPPSIHHYLHRHALYR